MDWTPYLVGFTTTLLGGFLTALAYLFRMLGTLSKDIAILIEHNKATDAGILDAKKAHDEIIDLKLASSVLNERSKAQEADIHSLNERMAVHHGI